MPMIVRKIDFPQRMTKFLLHRLDELREQYGETSAEYLALA